MFNVAYDCNDGLKHYLSVSVDYETAIEWMRKCRQQYVGKRYPNNRGFYDVRNVRVMQVEE